MQRITYLLNMICKEIHLLIPYIHHTVPDKSPTWKEEIIFLLHNDHKIQRYNNSHFTINRLCFYSENASSHACMSDMPSSRLKVGNKKYQWLNGWMNESNTQRSSSLTVWESIHASVDLFQRLHPPAAAVARQYSWSCSPFSLRSSGFWKHRSSAIKLL